MRIPILYRDADLVVIDKPVGVPTHAAEPSDPYPADAVRIVQAQLAAESGGSSHDEPPYLGMHQRLDADTSGVLVFAARRAANPALAAAFEGRAVRKVYLALVHGAPRQQMGVINAPIARLHGGRYGVAPPSDRQGQAAVTRYRVLETSPDKRYSLLEVTPETGRSHQIRVHLAHIDAPVVGDALYGPPATHAPRLCLHAYQLTIPHPSTGAPITFTAPSPALFDRLSTGLPELALAASLRHVRAATATEAGRASAGLDALLQLAVVRRAPLAADPANTVYRLVNGAADGLPGLTADRYGDALVVSLYDDDPTPPDPAPPEVIEALAAATGAASVYVKYRPKEAGRLAEAELARLAPDEPAWGAALGEFPAREDGLTYLVRPGDGLSTGIFPDMREGRGRVRAWAAGRRVLNCFAYTCAFGVAAMAGGAARTLNLDLSKPALERGQANYRANGFTPDPHDFVFGDVFDWLARLARRGDRFDLVILDPPGFSRTKSGRFSAARDYGALAGLAAGTVAPGGLLLACTNVADMPWRTFRDRVLAGLSDAGRAAEVLGVYHEPAVDFPAPAGQEPYLKLLLARLT
jgi:23S rRNA (cytosine1962-C5)-methyltransferase